MCMITNSIRLFHTLEMNQRCRSTALRRSEQANHTRQYTCNKNDQIEILNNEKKETAHFLSRNRMEGDSWCNMEKRNHGTTYSKSLNKTKNHDAYSPAETVKQRR